MLIFIFKSACPLLDINMTEKEKELVYLSGTTSFTCTFVFSRANLEAAGEGEKFVVFQSSEESAFLLPRSSVHAEAAKKRNR